MRKPNRALASIALAVAIAGTSACTYRLAPGERPAAAEFGLGPRASAHRVYTAALQPREPLHLRQLQTLPVRITDASGRPVELAEITIDGGMPQHGHGLPTQPRVKRALGDGVYEIEGVRFSMGGWWELKVAIAAPAGADVVTFNLDL